MHKTIKIKACPFCSYTSLHVEPHENKFSVTCHLCKSRGPEFEFENLEEDNFSYEIARELAIERWNIRPEPSEEFFPLDEDNHLDQAIRMHMVNKFPNEDDLNTSKFLTACDLFSWMEKFKKE